MEQKKFKPSLTVWFSKKSDKTGQDVFKGKVTEENIEVFKNIQTGDFIYIEKLERKSEKHPDFKITSFHPTGQAHGNIGL